MKKFLLLHTIVVFTFYCQSQNTNISGIINTYAAVNSISTNTITLSSTASLSVGDLVLIIQMQGATINETNTAAFGNTTSLNNAGNYEFVTICDILNSTSIAVTNIQRSYTIAGNVQLIGVPVYEDATITAPLTATQWDGSTGGVLAFQCNGTLVINESITVQGLGFRGGNVTNSSFSCAWFNSINDYFYNISTGQGAKKGEGIAAYITNKTGGAGPQSNGGGGGNDHNSGGGGGANAGNGGSGGERIASGTFTCSGATPGIGGKSISFSNTTNKIFLGGGGGAGHENNVNTGTPGSNGGGIVIIKANSIAGNSETINVQGAPHTMAAADGAGGGGSGGTVLLDVVSYSGSLNIAAAGANGGDVSNIGPSNCNGPGGGGSGGLLWIAQPTTPTNLILNNTGGNNGTTTNTTQPNCTPNGNNNAQSGNSGVLMHDLTFFNPICSASNIIETATICLSDSMFLQGAWQSLPGTYYDTIVGLCCDSIIQTSLLFHPLITDTLTDTICNGESITVNGNIYNTSTMGAIETLTNASANGCDSMVVINLTVLPPLSHTINETICSGESLIVNGTTYNSSVTGATEVFTNIGSQACDSIVTINLTVLPTASAVDLITSCHDFTWIDGNTYINSNNTATHTIIGGAANGCDSLVTLNLTLNTIDVSTNHNDSSIIANANNVVYQWLDCDNNYAPISGENLQNFIATVEGNYAVEISQNNCKDTSLCTLISPPKIEPQCKFDTLKIYPNPNYGLIKIDLGSYDAIGVRIYTASGKLLYVENKILAPYHEIIFDYPSGLYIIEVTTIFEKLKFKLIKT